MRVTREGRRSVRLLALVALGLVVGATAPESPVADAAMRGDVEAVRTLVRGGEDVNAAQGDGMTALHWAAEQDAADMAQLLVAAGAHLESTTRIGGFTPLLVAARSGSVEVLEVLVTSGAVADARATTGESALHFAAAVGRSEAVRVLVDAGADVDAREFVKGQTPLMFAAAFGRDEALRTLLDAGADLSLETETVDYEARAREDREEARRRSERLAVLHGEDVRLQELVDGTVRDDEDSEDDETSEDDEAEDDDGVEEGEGDPENEHAARRPFSYDQLVAVQGGNTALHYATREGHAKVAASLLEHGARLDHPTGGDGTTPLLMASINGHFDLAMWLLDQGADPNLASARGATPLYIAIHLQWVPKSFYPQPTAIKQEETTYLEFAEALLQAGADPDARLERHLWYTSFNHNVLGVDTWGATPFWRAAYGTDVEAMRLLVAYGADPSIPTRRPPGRVATGNNPEEEAETDPSGLPEVEVGGAGVFPIHAASGVGYGLGLAGNAHRHKPGGWLPSVRYLVEELGADVNARDYNGLAPLHNAAARGDVELITYLVEQGADVTLVTRRGQTTADMANGPVQRVTVFPEVVAMLERLGSKNNHNCVSCQ